MALQDVWIVLQQGMYDTEAKHFSSVRQPSMGFMLVKCFAMLHRFDLQLQLTQKSFCTCAAHTQKHLPATEIASSGVVEVGFQELHRKIAKIQQYIKACTEHFVILVTTMRIL